MGNEDEELEAQTSFHTNESRGERSLAPNAVCVHSRVQPHLTRAGTPKGLVVPIPQGSLEREHNL